MQDAVSPETQRILNLNVKRGVKSVYEFLKERGGLDVLSDPNVEIATREVLANGRPRPQITKDIRKKVYKRDVDLKRGKCLLASSHYCSTRCIRLGFQSSRARLQWVCVVCVVGGLRCCRASEPARAAWRSLYSVRPYLPSLVMFVTSQEAAVAQIKRRYATHNLSQDDIHTCLYSM